MAFPFLFRLEIHIQRLSEVIEKGRIPVFKLNDRGEVCD